MDFSTWATKYFGSSVKLADQSAAERIPIELIRAWYLFAQNFAAEYFRLTGETPAVELIIERYQLDNPPVVTPPQVLVAMTADEFFGRLEALLRAIKG